MIVQPIDFAASAWLALAILSALYVAYDQIRHNPEAPAVVIHWNILPGTRVAANAIDRQVPGPRLEFMEGDRIRINFTNHLPDSAAMHWHGLIVPNAMDGPGYITQAPVPPGGR